jgi:uncharacterized protein
MDRKTENVTTLESSSRWSEARSASSDRPVRVSYAGAHVLIPKRSRFYVDHNGRVLIGWHCTYDPPRGMDGTSLVPSS